MAKIASLAALIATSIVEKQIDGSPIPPEHFRLLVRAAQILLDNEVPWPPSVDIVLSEVSKRATVAGLAATSRKSNIKQLEVSMVKFTKLNF